MENILEDHVSNETLRNIEAEFYKKQNENSVDDRKKFEYAWCLTKSKFKTDIKKGIVLLEELCASGSPEGLRDYLFCLALANTKCGEYTRANECIKKFLQVEPENRQALELQYLIKKKMAQGLKGAALAGTAAVALGALVGLGISLMRK